MSEERKIKVVFTDKQYLVTCSECKAVVELSNLEAHADWHKRYLDDGK